MQYVEEQWELHRIEKEKEKLERVNNFPCCIKDIACMFTEKYVDTCVYILQTASQEEQTDWGGHAVRNISTDSDQTQIPWYHYTE